MFPLHQIRIQGKPHMKQPSASHSPSSSNKHGRPDNENHFEQYSRHSAWSLLTGCFSPFMHDECDASADHNDKDHKHS